MVTKIGKIRVGPKDPVERADTIIILVEEWGQLTM